MRSAAALADSIGDCSSQRGSCLFGRLFASGSGSSFEASDGNCDGERGKMDPRSPLFSGGTLGPRLARVDGRGFERIFLAWAGNPKKNPLAHLIQGVRMVRSSPIPFDPPKPTRFRTLVQGLREAASQRTPPPPRGGAPPPPRGGTSPPGLQRPTAARTSTSSSAGSR